MRVFVLAAFGLVFGSAVALYLDLNPGPPVPLPQSRPHIETSGEYEARLAEAQHEIRCLTTLVYTEARGEPILGQYLVAWVALMRHEDNRTDFGRGTLCDVVYRELQDKKGGFHAQFAGPIYFGHLVNKESFAYRRAFYIAWRVYSRQYTPPDRFKFARYFYNRKDSDTDGKNWHDGLTVLGDVGRHIFSQDPVPLPRPRPPIILATR